MTLCMSMWAIKPIPPPAGNLSFTYLLSNFGYLSPLVQIDSDAIASSPSFYPEGV